MKGSESGFFKQGHAEQYDERNSKLAPISGCLHFLMELLLLESPRQARVLSIGAGTGAEILHLARAFPEWTFVAVEPSDAMLDVCRRRLQAAGVLSRCELKHGYIQDISNQADFDIAVSLLVGHFVQREDRTAFYKGAIDRLRDDGLFINAEISYDLASKTFPEMLLGWEKVQALMGATPEKLADLPQMLRDALTVLPPSEVERMLEQCGVGPAVRFYQAFMITAWLGRKKEGPLPLIS